MTVRAKFKVGSITEQTLNDGTETMTGHRIRLNPVYGQAGENAIFGKATPQGSIDMLIANDDASDYFEPNSEYYVTFHKAGSTDDTWSGSSDTQGGTGVRDELASGGTTGPGL